MSETSVSVSHGTCSGENSSVPLTDNSKLNSDHRQYEGEEPSSKRRRRTGWDVNGKDGPSAAESTGVIPPPPALTSRPPMITVPTLSTPIVPAPVIATTAGLTPQQIAQQILAAKPNLAGLVAPAKQDCRIYVGSLHYDLKETDIIALFSSFGKVIKCDLGVEPGTNKSKGYCFVEFTEPHMAEAAMVMNGFDLAGRKVRIFQLLYARSSSYNALVD